MNGTTYTTTNNDDGSLRVGTGGERTWKVGDRLRIHGMDKDLTVTYISQAKTPNAPNRHIFFKGQGKIPMGELTYEMVGEAIVVEAA